MLRVGILISGRGSNMQALVNAAKTPGFPAEVACVISNEPDAKGLDFARAEGIPTAVVNHRDFKGDRQAFEEVLDAKLREYGVELVCLAGFMRLVTGWFVDQWMDKLVNIHPSLLPAFPGIHVHEKVIEYGAKFSGCTIHYVRAEMDHGPIIIQAAVPVHPDDDADKLAARILESEHKIYPLAVRMIAEGRVNVYEERVFATGAEPLEMSVLNPVRIK